MIGGSVIVIDDSGSDDDSNDRINAKQSTSSASTPSNVPNVTPQNASSENVENESSDKTKPADSASSIPNGSFDEITEKLKTINVNLEGNAKESVLQFEVDTQQSTSMDVVTSEAAPLDFTALLNEIENNNQQSKICKKKGPVCCNAWCDNSASYGPEEHIRDYYGIPYGRNDKLCESCINAYYQFISTAEANFENGGDMLEGRCPLVNDFIIIDNELDECEKGDDDEDVDPELEKLLTNALLESMNELNEKHNFTDIFNRTKDQVIEKLKDFIEEAPIISQKIAQTETDLYKSCEEFKATFKPKKLIALQELNIGPISAADAYAQSSGITPTTSGTNSIEPPNLPTYGELDTPVPKKGDQFYSIKDSQSTTWMLYKVTGVSVNRDKQGKLVESFNILRVVCGSPIKKVVSSELLAYPKCPTVRLGIGTRVIGGFNNNSSKKILKAFYSGLIAEYPTDVNQFRYLVFFDNGLTQYCSHEDIRVIYKPLKKPHEYYAGYNAEFIQNYLHYFPERSMLKTTAQQLVRVELNGYWINGQIDTVDGSLVRVIFLNDRHTEWIYRGSPRLRPVYDRLNANNRASMSKSVPVIYPVRQSTSAAGGSSTTTELEIVIDSSDDESPPTQPVRAVAKKSSSRPRPLSTNQVSKRPVEKRITRSCVVRKVPPTALIPNAFHYHKCSRACVAWVKYAEITSRGVNPLAIPSIFAFKRDIDVSSLVTYTAPCGKKLKNIQEVLKYLSETLIPLTLDMFDFDIRTQIFDEYVVPSQYMLMEDITFGGERNPIPCINEIDYQCPDLMSYMTERRPLEGVDINLDPGFLVCCDCEDNCRDRSKCRCWRLTVDCFKPFNNGEDKRHITKIGYQYQRLDQNLLSGIYECNSNCKCNTVTCINRVVQHPLKHKLQLFKTPKKGWGTRCVNDIPQGVFICTYVGNILTEPSANETGTLNGDEYFAELDHIEVMQDSKADFEAEAAKMTDEDEESAEETAVSPPVEQSSSTRALRSSTLRKRKRNSTTPTKPAAPNPKLVVNISDEESDEIVCTDSSDSEDEENSLRKFYGPNETVYVMDAKIAGNIGRYFNHSCDPNIFVQNVYVDTHDLRFPWVSFFALRHIPAGAELTWDYGYKIGSVPGKVLYCHCGTMNCRKRLL